MLCVGISLHIKFLVLRVGLLVLHVVIVVNVRFVGDVVVDVLTC